MLDWTPFQNAIVADTRPVALANACARAWRWLDLTPADRVAAVIDQIRTEADARVTAEALVLVRRRLWRDVGHDPDDMTQLQTALADVNTGRASTAVAAAVQRIDATIAIGSLIVERFPVAHGSDGGNLATLNAATPALSAAVEGTSNGIATPFALEALQHAIETFAPIGQQMGPATRREHAWWMGIAWRAMGRGAQELARHAEAHDAFEKAASYYDDAGDGASAAACRQNAHDLSMRLTADFDAVAASEVHRLLSPQEPLQRAATLTRLSREVGRSGDRFEAFGLGEQAAQLLDSLGFPDPESSFDSSIQKWIATAAEARRGTDVFGRLCEVTEHWAAVMGARINLHLSSDPARSEHAERTLRGLGVLPEEMSRQADLAIHAASERLTVWEPGASALGSSRSNTAAAEAHHALGELDDALHGLRVACNEGASDSQLTQATLLRTRAEALGSRVHTVRALIEHTYVLLALERHGEVPQMADLAVQTLLAGKPAQLGSFATGYERELYLTAIAYKARSLAARKDHHAILAACEPVIRDIETERTRVSSPYQQSAFLATRTELYEMVAAAAYRLGEMDLLLSVTELLKARAVLASRLTPDLDVSGTEAEHDLREVNDALRRTTPGSSDETSLRERRRWLSTLRAMAKARQGSALPEISVAAVQEVLAEDEAAISWFWISKNITLVLAFTRNERRVSVVELGGEEQRELREYLDCITALDDPRRAEDQLIPRIQDLVGILGDVLMPAATRELVGGKRRLVLSPHRTLHLFPFHAVPWQNGDTHEYLIERFAIRYVPNLTSLLLPWRGATRGPVLAVGVGQFSDPNLPPLPNAALEAAAVAAAHGASGEALLDADRAVFTARALGKYRCLHLATHGSSVLTGDALNDPMQSCVSLRDGALTALDLSSIELRAELVVLAACHSGQRAIKGRGLETLPGDDIFGLQAVLFEAGVWSVLGTLWPVGDETTSAIMLDFHRAYAAGDAPDQALQTAIRAHLASGRQWRDVFDWGPFFLSALGQRTA